MEELLIKFQCFMNDKGLITNHDWDYAKIARRFLKTQKQQNVKKGKLSDFFKNGDNFHFGDVDYASDEVSKEIAKVVAEQKKVIDSSKVNLNELRKITFDI